jgi:Plasmid pRiA4b ORF-3-like protein
MPRRPVATPAGSTCTFRVRILGGFYAPPDSRRIWREIELRADQTLADLGGAIAPAFGFDDDHLWSFFLSGKPWDRASEYARMTDPDLLAGVTTRDADRLRVGEAPAGTEFLFLFDYGDEWHFGVKLARSGEAEPGARYPRVVAAQGEAPPQYPEVEEDWDEEDWDEEAAEERARLLERFAAWAGQRGAADAVAMASSLLEYKSLAGDQDLGRWTSADLRDFLLEWCPRHLALPDDEVPRAIPDVRLLLGFLDQSGLLDPDGDRPETLEATLDWLAPRFVEAMRDPARFGPAKAIVAAVRSAGVDLGDRDAVDRFLSGYRLPPEVSLPELAAPELPPVELAPLEELQAAAAAAPTLRRLRALVEWLGEGRKLTAAGNLTLADGRELAGLLGLVDPDRLAGMRVRSSRDIAGLELLLGWARELRLARVHKGHLVPVRQHRRLLDDPLELCSRAVSVLPSLDAALPLTSMIESSFPDGLAEALVDLFWLLYPPEEPVSLGDLAGHVWEEHVQAGILDLEGAGQPQLWRLATAVETAQLLSHLQGLGMVEPAHATGTEGEPEAPEIVGDHDAATADPADAYLAALGRLPLRLTPLGTWQANVLLRAAGAVAPVIGELAGADAATLIEGVAGYDEQASQAELRAWCRRRGAAAAGELAGYLLAAPGFEQRMLAFAALGEAGPAAESEVRALLADPRLRPHAQLWLVEHGLEDERGLDPASAMLLMAETLGTILDADGPAGLVEHLERLGPPAEQASVLAELWRAGTPRVAAVLEAAGKAHPDAKVAKAARKAAFKLRSSGTPDGDRA